MIAQFPFKNIVVNQLLGFSKAEEIDYWIKYEGGTAFKFDNKTSFERSVETYRELIPNFENEYLQIVSTTNQATIDYYFDELRRNVELIYAELSTESLELAIANWNLDKIAFYNKKILTKEKDYFDSNNRERNHLEKYTERMPKGGYLSFLGGHREWHNVEKINYNFYCVTEDVEVIDPSMLVDYHDVLTELADEFLSIVIPLIENYDQGLIKTQVETVLFNKPVVFVEGRLDIIFIEKAAELLGKNELLSQVEIRHRNGISGLDKLWQILCEDSWETIPQKKLLLYDCDAGKQSQHDTSGLVFRRSIPLAENHLIQKGIENLFPNAIVQRAEAYKLDFIDTAHTTKRVRGKVLVTTTYEINKEEKTNFCNWICENATAFDFEKFNDIFQLISDLLIEK